jgi:hypothetical protein
MESHLLTITHAIQLAVAPVFLLTGVAGLMNVLSSRLARIVDRRRALLQRAADEATQPGDISEIAALDERARLMYLAVFFAVLAALMVCLVVMLGFIGALTQIDIGRWLAVLFIASMAGMIVSLSLFLREVYVAVVPGKMHRRA